MKFLLFFAFVLLFNAIKGDVIPVLMVPREQELPQPLMMGKTIIISGKKGQINTEDPNVMQAVMDAVNNQFKADPNGRDANGNDIPEVIITDSEPQQSQQGMNSPFESVQKVYNLPPMTRMISSEEETEIKNSPLWRSPLPLPQSEECPHHKQHKKSKLSKKKGRKHHKSAATEGTTTVKPIVEETENQDSFGSLLTSIISNAVMQSSEPERNVNEVRPPTSFLMSISRRVHPEPMERVPFLARPRPHGFIAILHKKNEPLPIPQPEPQITVPNGEVMPPFNPFLALLSKLREPMEPNIESKTESNDKKEKEPKTNFNFNVNLTVNNFNYAQPDGNDFVRPFPLIFN